MMQGANQDKTAGEATTTTAAAATNNASTANAKEPQQVGNATPSVAATSTQGNLEHLRLDFFSQQDMDLYKRLCSNCIYQGIVDGVENKEKAISDEIGTLNEKIWNLFSQLMNEDCLNSAKPDQFLPIKNMLNVKLANEGSVTATDTASEQDLNKQLEEAFADINNAAPSGFQQNQPSMPVLQHMNNSGSLAQNPGLFRHQSNPNVPSIHRKKSYGWSQSGNTAMKEAKKFQSIQQQLQEYKDQKLRNDILGRVQTDLLPSNRLQLECATDLSFLDRGRDSSPIQDFSYLAGRSKDLPIITSDEQINHILKHRMSVLGAKTDDSKMQTMAPHTQNTQNNTILQNSYISELDLGQISDQLDIEMAVMLDPKETLNNNKNNSEKKAIQSENEAEDQQISAAKNEVPFLNMNCSYDFRPTNFNFLLLSRFSFAMKRRRIQKLIRKRKITKENQLKKQLTRIEDIENRGRESRKRNIMIENKTIETLHPRLYRDHIESRVKQDELLQEQGLDLGKTGVSTFEFAPTPLNPQTALKTTRPPLSAYSGEIPEDILRAKACSTIVPQPRYNEYTARPIQIQIQHRFKLIEDPLDYEMEYKKQNVWSFNDIKTFLIELLRGPKRFEKIGEGLPHKTASEIVFFYHTFKKYLNLKQEIKNSREYLKMRINQQQQEISFAKQAEQILEPLQLHMRGKNPSSGSGSQSGIFQVSSTNMLSNSFFGTNNQSSSQRNLMNQNIHSEGKKDQVREQTRFNIEELLQIFSSRTFNTNLYRRKPPKGNSYASLHNNVSASNMPPLGLYQHDTFKIQPEFLGQAQTAGPLSDFQQAQQAAVQNGAEPLDKPSGTEDNNANTKKSAASAPATPAIKAAQLQKVDYLEYIEQTGKDVIDLLVSNKTKVESLTSKLREKASEKIPEFVNLDNDSWRKVNYLNPQQQKIGTLLEHQRRLFTREQLLQQQENQGLEQILPEQKHVQVGKELKCSAHARIMETQEYWQFSLPQTHKTPKKKNNDGFTKNYFVEMEKNSQPNAKGSQPQNGEGQSQPTSSKQQRISKVGATSTVSIAVNNQKMQNGQTNANSQVSGNRQSGSEREIQQTSSTNVKKAKSQHFQLVDQQSSLLDPSSVSQDINKKEGSNAKQLNNTSENGNKMLNSKENNQQNAGNNNISTSAVENNGNAGATSNFVSMAAAQQQQNLVNAQANSGQQSMQHSQFNSFEVQQQLVLQQQIQRNQQQFWFHQQQQRYQQQQQQQSNNDSQQQQNQQNPNGVPMGSFYMDHTNTSQMPYQSQQNQYGNFQYGAMQANNGVGGNNGGAAGQATMVPIQQSMGNALALAPIQNLNANQQMMQHQHGQQNKQRGSSINLPQLSSMMPQLNESSQMNNTYDQGSHYSQVALPNAVNNAASAAIQSKSRQALKDDSDSGVLPNNMNSKSGCGASNSSTNQWTIQEKQIFISCLKKYGKDFKKISENLKRRTVEQCRNYFQNYKQKLNLLQYVKDFEAHAGHNQ